MSDRRRITRGIPRPAIALLAMAVLALAAASVQAEKLPPGSVRVLPDRPAAPATLAWHASFDQPPAAQLQAYNVDIARGYRFDPRAVRETCTLAEARASSCPAASKIGGGSGQVTVFPPSGAPQELSLGIKFFLTAPQRRHDLAGLVLAAHEPASGLTFNLIGRMVRLPRGRYGLELRFADTAAELPSNITVQLHRVNVRFGTQRSVTVGAGHNRRRVTYHLLTNPPTCGRHGWPFLLTVSYTTGTERYAAYGRCHH
jgi:hypothetical protein